MILRKAILSPCQQYRYILWRTWSAEPQSPIVFVGLNPSTADGEQDDPTIRRCMSFAKSFGYSSLLMLNIYAFRATNPKALKHALDPVGPDNNYVLNNMYLKSKTVACWGTNVPEDMEKRILSIPRDWWCLGQTKAGHPKHPLYLKQSTQLRRLKRSNQ